MSLSFFWLVLDPAWGEPSLYLEPLLNIDFNGIYGGRVYDMISPPYCFSDPNTNYAQISISNIQTLLEAELRGKGINNQRIADNEGLKLNKGKFLRTYIIEVSCNNDSSSKAIAAPLILYETRSEKKNIQIKLLFELIDAEHKQLLDSFKITAVAENKDSANSGLFMLLKTETKTRSTIQDTLKEAFKKVAEHLKTEL